MIRETDPLMSIYKGWDGYQLSLVHAIAPLSCEQLAWRPMPQLRSVGEIAAMLGIQGIAVPELGDLGGHVIEPPLAESS